MIIFGEKIKLIHKLVILMNRDVLMFIFDVLNTLSGVFSDVFGTDFGIFKEDADIDGSLLHKIFYKREIIKWR